MFGSPRKRNVTIMFSYFAEKSPPSCRLPYSPLSLSGLSNETNILTEFAKTNGMDIKAAALD